MSQQMKIISTTVHVRLYKYIQTQQSSVSTGMDSRYSCFEIVGAAAAAGAFFVTRDEESAGALCTQVVLALGARKKSAC